MTGLLTDYTNRITSEYKSQPNFLATIQTTCQPFVEGQATLNGFPANFDLEQAVGAQLDQIGEWLNFSRQVAIPLPNVFFEWDIGGVGWDQGVWFGPFDPITGLTNLDDNTYRAVLQLKAAYNTFKGSNGEIISFCQNLFPSLFPGATLSYKDNQNMSVTYTMGGVVQSVLVQQLFLKGFLTIPPMGCSVNYQIVAMVAGNAAGAGAASGVPASAMMANGIGTASGVGQAVSDTHGQSAGLGAAAADANALMHVTGQSSGTSSAFAISLTQAIGQSSGTSSANAVSDS
jgi:hypothetical protein